ncbi:non-ribosomal peptide synthetase [Amycolatopsis rubida]|uniref:Non-ribosomal peptide synthetase n=1 Tax=Amycolatopsis rubida TaxID=112413 RepID=A0ABX0BXH2_9PSEU|nr:MULTISPECIES: non-ribosomal peptide synthetase [Amycolatopsis]MYW92504.1 non-ribosomal peptide synthetase [Amycolatopsis rubida]NEC57491.1 non-ribosomal peptide synthetase [Amycolatopsis rubida]OAP26994.1 Linear gramicidin synthase subunit B [Amycolatopsis sp. M39]
MPRRERRPANPFPLVREPAAGGRPPAAGQERLWWVHQLDSANGQYHILEGWKFPQYLEPAALGSALAGLVRRHELLRTRFAPRPDGTVVLEVLDEVAVPVDWAGRDWRAALDDAAARPFDLARPPLFRVIAAEFDDGPRLCMVMHHIVTDRASMDVLSRDLAELYAAAVEDRPARLPELPVQYGDYAAWQRKFRTEERLAQLLGWWRDALAGHERPELPLDRPRPAAADGAGDTVVARLSEETASALADLAWRARATPFIVVLAALAATMSAYTGSDDVVLGAIVSDRPHPDLQDLVGFFINTVPVRIRLDGPDLTFRDLIVRARDAWMAADAHQDAPFEQIAGAAGDGARSQRNPVFDAVLNHAGDRVDLTESGGALSLWRPELPTTARFDLSVTTLPADGGIEVTFLYRQDLFDRAPIEAMTARYVRLIEQAVAEPERPLRDFALVSARELQLLHSRNDPSPAPEATVVELFQAQAASRGEAPAVTGADGTLSYRELNERANQLARHLSTLGAGPERIVGVCLEHSVERYVVLLAIAKCGGAYLPLDPGFPAERLRFLLEDSGAVLTVVSPSLHTALPADTGPVLEFGRGTPDLTGAETGDLPLAARPANLAYLISTSGSTGTPKSVAIPHRGLSRLVAGAPRYLETGPGTTFLQAGPLTFDVAVLEWTALANGGCVVVADTGTLQENLEPLVRDHGVTTLKLVSPQLDLLVERGIQTLAGVRQLVVGGDVVNPKSFAAALDLLPGCRVTASYGPTESTVLATVFEGRPGTGRVPVGHAVPHTRAYVLDRNLGHCPVGMPGEICLAGDGLARGYLGRPGLTAEKFVPDPHGPPGSRMYRTGDAGRYLADGEIDFLGRTDRQVKIRGFRIETSEIEHALLRSPGVSSAIVLRAERETGPCLAAYVVASGEVDRDALRRQLRESLPAYMVPDHIVEVPRIPLTANNKTDRAALAAIPLGPSGPAEAAPPETGLEARIAEAWSAVLGHPVPAAGDFFEHGGHSLLVPRATAAIRQLLGREVSLRLMLDHRTPASYARALSGESAPDLGAASRENRLERQTWHHQALGGSRRVDLFVSAADPAAPVTRALVVLDGSEFVDVMRFPAILDRLALAGRIPPTAAIFLSPADWSGRRAELLDDAYVDVLADDLVPRLRDWLGDRWRGERVTALGASLGAIAAVRAALRRPDCFDGAVGISGPFTDYELTPRPDGGASRPARLFLAAGQEEAGIELDDGLSLLEATKKVAAELSGQGHAVRDEYGDGGHTYAAWEAALPEAVAWVLGKD